MQDAVPWSTAEGALPVDDGMAWMVDYQEALTAGMAVTVPLEAPLLADIRDHGLTLVAVGVRDETASAGTATLEHLLRAHLYTDGLEILPQGTPTNNTDEAIAGYTAAIDDADDFFARELDGAHLAIDADADAVRLTRALGLRDSELLGRVLNGDGTEEASARAMNRALWPATWGRYFSSLMAPEVGASVIPAAAITTVHEWFVAHVRGGAALPVIAVGAQPYGILPVRRTVVHERMTSPFQNLEWTLLDLRERWRESLSAVPRLDPVVGDGIGSEPKDDTVALLGSLPHPGRFIVRRLSFQRSIKLFFWDWIWLEIDKPSSEFHPLSTWYNEHESEIHDIDSQLDVLERLRANIPLLLVTESEGDADRLVAAMIAMAEAHRARQDPHQRLFPAYISGIFDDDIDDDPKLFWSGYGTATDDRVFSHALVQAEGATSGETAWDYLGKLRSRVPGLVSSDGGVIGKPGLGRVAPLLRRTAAMRSVTDARKSARQATGPAGGVDSSIEPGGGVLTGGGLTDAFHSAEPLFVPAARHGSRKRALQG